MISTLKKHAPRRHDRKQNDLKGTQNGPRSFSEPSPPFPRKPDYSSYECAGAAPLQICRCSPLTNGDTRKSPCSVGAVACFLPLLCSQAPIQAWLSAPARLLLPAAKHARSVPSPSLWELRPRPASCHSPAGSSVG